MRQVADGVILTRDPDLRLVEAVVGTLEEAIEQPQLVEDLHRRGVDGVAAEIAEEVGMLFQNPDRDAGARKQQADHYPRWAAADDEDVVSHGPAPRLRS